MLPSTQRLNSAEVTTLLQDNSRKSGSLLQILYAPKDSTKAAAIVGKKIARGAVARNYQRRRIYHLLHQHWQQLPTGLHLAVMLKRDGLGASLGELEKELTQLLEQAKK